MGRLMEGPGPSCLEGQHLAQALGEMRRCEGRARAPRDHSFLCGVAGKALVLSAGFIPFSRQRIGKVMLFSVCSEPSHGDWTQGCCRIQCLILWESVTCGPAGSS